MVNMSKEAPAPEQLARTAYEFTFRISARLLEGSQAFLFYALLAYAAFLTLPLSYVMPATGIDPSWQFAVNTLHTSAYRYGPDVVYTYGPLGFITCPEPLGSNIVIALVARLMIWFGLFGPLAIAYRTRRVRWGVLLAIGSVLLAHGFLTTYTEDLLAIVGLVVILGWQVGRPSWWLLLSFAALSIADFLTKQSLYVGLVLSLVVYVGLRSVRERCIPELRNWILLATVVAAPIAAYMVYDPRTKDLWDYMTGVSNIVGGYSIAMSIQGLPRQEYLYLSLLVLLLLGLGALGSWHRWFPIETAGCICAALLFAIKHSVVRDLWFMPFIYPLALVLVGLFALHCRHSKFAAVTVSLCFVSVAGLSISTTSAVWPTFATATWSLGPIIQQLKNLTRLQWSIDPTLLERSAGLRADRLPGSIREAIGQAPTVIFPWEVAYAPANNLNWVPLYTLQSYATYTHKLDVMSAERLLTKTPVDTRLLMDWKSIDGRHPLLDLPATWKAIYMGFDPEVVTLDHLLLKKRSSPRNFHLRPIVSKVIDLREWQDVPDREHAVTVNISMAETVSGVVRSLLYKINPVYIEFDPDHGGPQRFRVVPDVLRQSFVINCLPLSADALESVLFENQCSQKIKRFRFSGDGLASFSPTAAISFSEAPDETFRFPAAADADWRETKVPPRIQNTWSGVVEAVAGRPLFRQSSGANPVEVQSGDRLEIQGWAASGGESGEAFEGIFAVLGSRQFKAISVSRPDVVEAFQNPKLGKSGFRISINTLALGRGRFALRLAGVTRTGLYYECPNRIYIRVR